jgi:hypothetical protein
MTRCAWVDSRKAEGFPVTVACSVAKISTTTFYQWTTRFTAGPSDSDRDEAYLIDEIVDIHGTSDGTYGVPRIHAELRRKGRAVNHKKVERLMREHSIHGVFKARKVRTTIAAEDNPPIPDLVGRRFDPGCPDAAWAGDITYIRTGEGWLYVASMLDLGSRRLLGYSMADHMRTELVADALDMAVGARGGDVAGVIVHGDSETVLAGVPRVPDPHGDGHDRMLVPGAPMVPDPHSDRRSLSCPGSVGSLGAPGEALRLTVGVT